MKLHKGRFSGIFENGVFTFTQFDTDEYLPDDADTTIMHKKTGPRRHPGMPREITPNEMKGSVRDMWDILEAHGKGVEGIVSQ